MMRRLVFELGLIQVIACTAILCGTGALLGLSLPFAIVIGVAGAMSSTAIVVQILAEEKRLAAPVGRGVFAVLLLQDLAVVPILFALGWVGQHPQTPGGIAVVAAQAIGAVLGIVGLGRLALRPLLRGVARTRSPELFVAACLFIVLATARATAAVGLSEALGALIGGLLLASTEYRRQVEITIDPFKGLLVGVFLISVGMGLDVSVILATPAQILGAVALLVVLKCAVVLPVGRVFGFSWITASEAGLLLGPAGEFSFVILSVATTAGLLPHTMAAQASVVAALSMVAIPILARLGRQLARRQNAQTRRTIAALESVPHSREHRVIIAGYGRVGQTVAGMQEHHRVPYVALDRDPDLVARHHAAGQPVYYVNVARSALLQRLDLPFARALVVTMDERSAVDEVVAAARAKRSDLLIVARARDATHAAALYRIGASDAVPETVEASLQLSEAVLVDVGVPMGPVIASIHEKRAEIQASIKALAPQAEIRSLGRRRLRDALPAEARAVRDRTSEPNPTPDA